MHYSLWQTRKYLCTRHKLSIYIYIINKPDSNINEPETSLIYVFRHEHIVHACCQYFKSGCYLFGGGVSLRFWSLKYHSENMKSVQDIICILKLKNCSPPFFILACSSLFMFILFCPFLYYFHFLGFGADFL